MSCCGIFRRAAASKLVGKGARFYRRAENVCYYHTAPARLVSKTNREETGSQHGGEQEEEKEEGGEHSLVHGRHKGL